MRLRLERRPATDRVMLVAAPLLAVALTLAAGAVLFAAMGFPPLATLEAFFVRPIATPYGFGELFVKATPLVLVGIGLAAGFRAGVWNIGAEGQLVMGAIAGGGLALAVDEAGGPWLLPAMMAAGIAGGAAWAAIPAWLRTRFNASEILTSLMLTYVAGLLLVYLVHGPWRDPAGFNFPESKTFGPWATLPGLVEGTRVHLGVPVALALAALAWLVMARGFIGFQMRVLGLAPAAARYAGFSERRLVWVALLAGGGLAGLAGLFEVAGPIGQLLPQVSPGYGFTAIIVAFLGRLHPAGVLLAGFLVALSYLGGETAQIELGVPLAATNVFQGMLLFFLLAVDVLARYRLRLRPARTAAA